MMYTQKLALTPYPAFVEQSGEFADGIPFLSNGGRLGALVGGLSLLPQEGSMPVLLVDPDDSAFCADAEGYCLTVAKDRITIAASAPAGYLYGIVTLCQLYRQYKSALPCLTIADKPRWKHRGVQVSYAQINLSYRAEWLARFVKQMAELKVNYIYLYIEWRFQFPSIPATWNKEYLTPADVKEMTALCAQYNISLAPALNVMGHTGDFLSAQLFDDLKEYDPEKENYKSAGPAALCPSSPKTRALIKTALTDIMDAFDSPIIHVGGDEVPLIGTCPLCRPIKEEKGVEGIYVEYFCWIRDLLKERGRTMGIWGDMIEHYLGCNPYYANDNVQTSSSAFEPLKEGTIVFNWSYDGPATKALEALSQIEMPVICSTSTHACSVGAIWLGQHINQHIYFKDGFQYDFQGGLVTDWINGFGYHAEQVGINYASGEALMWQGADDTFAAGTTREDFEHAYVLQRFGGTDGTMEAYWHLAGDGKSDLLKHFDGQKSGSALRKSVYLNVNPIDFWARYTGCLQGEHLCDYRSAVEKLQVLWDKLEAAHNDDPWFIFQKAGMILHRHLLNRYQAIDDCYSFYARAAQVQYTNPAEFAALLDQSIHALENYSEMFDEPLAFAQLCHARLGLERGSVLRLQKAKENYQTLIGYLGSLRDGHRPIPTLTNISAWLFNAPLTGFWEPRSDEWYEEPAPYQRIDIDAKTEWGSARW